MDQSNRWEVLLPKRHKQLTILYWLFLSGLLITIAIVIITLTQLEEPRRKHLYQNTIEVGTTFTPRSALSKQHITVDNDNFCDLSELDNLIQTPLKVEESGTSACSFWTVCRKRFICSSDTNRKIIFSSRVADGVCDCCDGSDEIVGGLILCPNTCNNHLRRISGIE